MSEVSYSNVPPMMAAIKSGDIEAIRSLLHARRFVPCFTQGILPMSHNAIR